MTPALRHVEEVSNIVFEEETVVFADIYASPLAGYHQDMILHFRQFVDHTGPTWLHFTIRLCIAE